MESSSFYLTLPSNASKDIYPNNTASVYQIRLPRTMYLGNNYEVGLAEVQYPHTWPTFVDYENYLINYALDISVPNQPSASNNDDDNSNEGDSASNTVQETGQIVLPRGYYSSIEDLIQYINLFYKRATQRVSKTNNVYMKLIYHRIVNRVELKLLYGHAITFNRGLAQVLGFAPGRVYTSSQMASNRADVRRGFYTLYIYCSICAPQVVGDYYVPLLRSVGIEGNDGDTITKTYNEPHYVPINTTKFDTIEINIKNDVGEDVSFLTGKVICKLHFRPKSI